MAGTIAAARNGVGIVGVAPNVRMASVKVVNDDGFIYPEYAVCGFVWSGLKHMDVTNNSYYVDPFMYYCEDQPDQYAAKEAVRRAVAWCTKQGVVHAAAAGNAATDLSNNTTDTTSPDDGTPVARTINSGCEDIPTELPGVVTVSSVSGPANTLDSASASATEVSASSTSRPRARRSSRRSLASNGYGLMNGTSMASPHVAGVLCPDEVGPPDVDAGPDGREVCGGRPTTAPAAPRPAGPVCVGRRTKNSYFGEGIVDALDAVS